MLCFAGQALSGYVLQHEHAGPASPSTSVADYLATPDFLKAVFSNWQAALLQLLTLVVFAVFLRQRGASHSLKPEGEGEAKQQPTHGALQRTRSWIYCNSLSLAFLLLFAGAFAVFFLSDRLAYNQERVHAGERPVGLLDFLTSARFWFDTFQTWQAEFFAMGAFLLLSIFLRQEGSAESKAVGASDESTGDTNE